MDIYIQDELKLDNYVIGNKRETHTFEAQVTDGVLWIKAQKVSDNPMISWITVRSVLSNEEIVQQVKEELDLGDTSNIISDLTLPTDFPEGVTVTWTSSNTDVVQNDGTVTRPIDEDATVELTALIEKGSASTTKTFTLIVLKTGVVIEDIEITDLTLDQTAIVLELGQSVQLNVSIQPENATNKQLVWTSDNEHVAVVDENGNITAIAPGAATVTVTAVAGGKTAAAEVTVEDNEVPTWEVGGKVTASNVTTSSLRLTWDAAQDNDKVTGYRVIGAVGDEIKIEEQLGDVTTVTLTGLSANTSYTFKVEARDTAGNWSTTALSVTVTTKKQQSNNPSQPVEPEPEQPTVPEQPTEPEQPVEPEQPTEPQQPAQPNAEFTDVPTTHWAAAAIARAASLGIVKGNPDGSFKPNAATNRAEFVTMLANALKWQAGTTEELDFIDNDSIGDWAKSAIAQAVERGIISGYTDGSFRPNQHITRTEMIVILARALGVTMAEIEQTDFADDDTIPTWGKGAVAALHESGIISGRSGNTFAPNEEATRAEAITIILRILDKR